MNKEEASRSIFLINLIERTAVRKKAAEEKGNIRKWSRFHTIQLQAKFELREILKREEQRTQEIQEREQIRTMLQDMQRRGLVSSVKVVARMHKIPLEEVMKDA